MKRLLALTLLAACSPSSEAPDSDARDLPDVPDLTDAIDLADLPDVPDLADLPEPDTTNALLPPLPGPAARYDFARPTFFAAPVPAPDLFSTGHADLAAFPHDPGSFVADLVAIASESRGAGLASTVYFAFDASLENQDIATLSAAFIPVAPAAAQRPARLHFEADGGPHGAPNLLAIQPIQGLPLAPSTTYAAVVMTTPEGRRRLGRSPTLAAILRGDPTGLTTPETWQAAVSALPRAGLDPELVIGLTVLTTDDPVSELADFIAAARLEPAPDLTGFTLVETHDAFCVYGKTLDLPDYQHGPLPYSNAGEGLWRRDEAGRPVLAKRSPSRVFLTVPRLPSPPSGYPLVVFIRTGGGGDRPLIDRGPRAAPHGPPIVPTGTGPAMNFAAAGWAGLTWDGPHGGPRNPTAADEQFLMFNVVNPAGTRDNIRQTALEAVLLAGFADAITVDTAACPGASATTRFDPAHLALMGHSMGAWIAPLALAHEPRFEAAILSGAGGSWSANIVYKKSPLEVRPLAETLLGYDILGRSLGPFDPALMLLQWAGEAADPQSYGHMIRNSNILMIEGIVDTYILPPIANATILSLGLDLGGDAHDDDPRLAAYDRLTALLPLAGLSHIPLPAQGNRGPRTAVVVQAPEDGIEDGHEAAFQTPGPKFQYRCFLASLLSGTPIVPAPGAEWDPCDSPQ